MGLGTIAGVTYEALSLQNNLYMNSTALKYDKLISNFTNTQNEKQKLSE